MAFLIGGANTESAAYEIDNSIRMNEADSTKLTNDEMSDGSRDIWTFSGWFKKTNVGETGDSHLFSCGTGGTELTHITLRGSGDAEQIKCENYVDSGSTTRWAITTPGSYRDPTAWYHLVLAVDTTQASISNGLKLWINGEAISYTGSTWVQNADTCMNSDDHENVIGARQNNNDMFFDGYLAEINFIDGTQKQSTDFGKFNSNGVWIPIKYSGSYGTNGYSLEFKGTGTNADASGMGADTSGNGHHFSFHNLASANGDTCTDTPTNNFCTLNSIGGANSSGKWTFSEGNCKIQQNDNGSWRATGSTMAVSKGKWYWEVEFDAGTLDEMFVGFHDTSVSLEGTNRWVAGSLLFYNHTGGEVRLDGTDTTADYGELDHGDILGIALNMDDNQVTFYDNGSAIVTNLSIGSNINEAMPTFLSDYNDVVYKVNFGNPPFSISSGNADANGYGNFEYAVPSGYYALCTKNLAEYG